MKKKIINSDPKVMGGTPCFTGTRVPVQTLMDYIKASDSIDEFLKDFPTVKRWQVVSFLEEAADSDRRANERFLMLDKLEASKRRRA